MKFSMTYLGFINCQTLLLDFTLLLAQANITQEIYVYVQGYRIVHN